MYLKCSFIYFTYILNNLPLIVFGDRFCQISQNDSCGDTLKSGKCDLAIRHDYDYFLDDIEIIPIKDYKNTMLGKFNNVRRSIYWSMGMGTMDKFRTSYGNMEPAIWHDGMEIIAENIARRTDIKKNFCIRVENFEFTHMVVSMLDFGVYDRDMFIFDSIQLMMNVSKNTGKIDDLMMVNHNLFFFETNALGCALVDKPFETPTKHSISNIHLHCVFNVMNQNRNYIYGDTCRECKTKKCNLISTYICVPKPEKS